MRYYFTDFFNWEQPRIDELRAEGRFVYSVIDAEGEHYLIKRWGVCNRFAFLVTDEDILPKSNDPSMDYITDEDFELLGGEEDKWVMHLIDDKAAECAALQKEYERKQKEAMETVRRRYA